MEERKQETPILQLDKLTKVFPIKQPILDVIARKPQKKVMAVDGVSFSIDKGETMGLVGESGCGKSTLSKTIIGLYEPDDGKLIFDGKDFTAFKGKEKREIHSKIQMVFQDPYSSLNPRMSVYDALAEALSVHKICSKSEMDDKIAGLLKMVGMGLSIANRYPGEFSGGQRQRIGIARALSVNPQFLIADEPVSALDVSIQAQVINLLSELQQSLNLTMLFISHDLRVVKYITHRVTVMYLGKVMEIGPTEEIYAHPLHPYTNILIQAAPVLDPRKRKRTYVIKGEPPSPIDLPKGCRFSPRCPYAKDICRQQQPEMKEIAQGRKVACHFPL